LDLAKGLNEDFYAVDAVHMLAIIAPPESSLTLNLQAIQLAESSGQEKTRNLAWLVVATTMGWAYHDMGEYESALNILRKPKHSAGQKVSRTRRESQPGV